MIKQSKRLPVAIAGIFLAGLITTSQSVLAAPSQTQIDALRAIYLSLNGQEWSDQTGWNTTTDPCTGWLGITCNTSGTGVTSLTIEGNNAYGSIPSSISDLTDLEELVITAMGLAGSSIPASIGNLSKLKGLFLNDNGLSGTIPAEFGQLSQLQTLSLDDNQLTGSIPIELMSLTQLYGLRLHHNFLSGPIPSQISNLSQLRALTLQRNSLTGEIPSSIADLSELTEINIDWNALHTSDASVSTLINQKSSSVDYIDTQTLDAANNREADIGETAIKLYWDQRNTTPATTGGYKIYIATEAAGPYGLNQSVSGKSSDTARVDGLNANSTYFFQVRSFTSSHEENPQPGELESSGQFYTPKQITTLAAGVGNSPVGETETDSSDSDSSNSSGGGGGGSLTWLVLALLPLGFRFKR